MNAPLLRPEADEPVLVELLSLLQTQGYAFVTPSPDTHAAVLSREPRALARDLRDVFGWSRPFEPGVFPEVEAMLAGLGLLETTPDGLRSAVRVSTLNGRLLLHSAYPTESADAVFLGPDSYRFARFIRAQVSPSWAAFRVFDIGCGAGVGAITAAALLPRSEVLAGDVNPAALRFTGANTTYAGLPVATVESAGMAGVEDDFDLILANPPYIADDDGRTYRDGGGALGAELSMQWAREACERLRPGGRMLLYTGSAIVEGRDAMCEGLEQLAAESGLSLAYEELDPDVFGSEPERPAYREVERIAAVGAVLTRA